MKRALFITAGLWFASLGAAEPKTSKDFKANQEIRLALTHTFLFDESVLRETSIPTGQFDSTNFNGRLPQHSVGAAIYYGYVVSPRSIMGVNLGYRFTPGRNNMRQFIAGMMTKIHFIKSNEVFFRPYVTFGFQAVTSWVKIADKPDLDEGAHRSIHLGLGAVIAGSWYIEVGYAYSRFAAFNASTKANFDFLNTDVGYRFFL